MGLREPRSRSPLELGLSTSILPERALPDGLKFIAEAQVPWIEIHAYNAEEFDFENQSLVAATKQTVTRSGLRVWWCHGPAYEPLDLASTDSALRQHTCTVIRDAMRILMEFEPRVFVCDAVGSPKEGDKSSARSALYAESLQKLLEEAKRLGMRLAIENHTEDWGLFVTPDDFLRLTATYGLDGLGVCWDTGHGWIAGQSPDVVARLGSHIVTLHVHDNNGESDDHRLPTSGEITWTTFADCLRRVDYAGPFMMELVPPTPCSPDAIRGLVAKAVEVHRRLTPATPPA